MIKKMLRIFKIILGTIFYHLFYGSAGFVEKIVGKVDLRSSKPNVQIGKENKIFPGSFRIKDGGEQIIIGNYGAFGHNITIIGANHNSDYPAHQVLLYKKYFGKYPGHLSKGPIIIGHDVRIGDNVTILSGVNIGNGAIIGAGSIVTKDVPAYGIVGGVPAKLIKMRYNEETIQFLQELCRWNWDDEKIRKNEKFFYSNINELSLNYFKNLIS